MAQSNIILSAGLVVVAPAMDELALPAAAVDPPETAGVAEVVPVTEGVTVVLNDMFSVGVLDAS
jgi:hypothetical protein